MVQCKECLADKPEKDHTWLTVHNNRSGETSRKIPPRLPYDIPKDIPSNLGTVRITNYNSPHISSFHIIPSLVDMLSFAFNAEQMGRTQLSGSGYKYQNEKSALELNVENTVQGPMEYSDLLVLAKSIVSFQQAYIVPGLTFEFWEGEKRTGRGSFKHLLAGEAQGMNDTSVATS